MPAVETYQQAIEKLEAGPGLRRDGLRLRSRENEQIVRILLGWSFVVVVMSKEKQRVIVRYRVRPEHVEENVRLVEAVFAELARTRPAGLAYASFRDGTAFVHVAEIDLVAANNNHPLQRLSAFRAFTADIAARCEEPPATTAVTVVGSYGTFGDTP